MVQKKAIEGKANDMSMPTIEMYLRTTLLMLSLIVLGIAGEMIGPTIGILAYNTHVTYNGIATALASGSVGGLITNIVCGFFQNAVNNYQDLMLTMAFFLRATVVCTIPFVNSLVLLCVLFFFQGVVGSVANMGTKLLLHIWKSRSAAPLNVVHFGYGFGAILANLIVRPFMNTATHISSQSKSVFVYWDIRIPYLIAGTACLAIGIGHLIFLIKGERPKTEYVPVSTVSCKDGVHSDEVKYSQYSPATFGHGHFGYGLSLSILFTAYIFVMAGTDQMCAKFYFSYLKFDKFGISTNGASWGIILFWSSFSIGRLIGAIESLFIPVHICLAFTWCGGLLLATAWMVYVWILGLTSTTLFVLGSLTGLVIGPLYGLSFAWINHKLNITTSLLAMILCGCGLGSSVLQKIAGFVMDRDPNHFPTLITASVMTSIILYILSTAIAFFHERGMKNKEDSIVNDESMVNYLQSVDETSVS